jgi:hypothetical protein
MDRIISSSELQMLLPGELSALFAQVNLDAGQHEPGTQERRNALVSLENIRRVLATQQFKPPGS